MSVNAAILKNDRLQALVINRIQTLEKVQQAHGKEDSTTCYSAWITSGQLPRPAYRRAHIKRLVRRRNCADATSSCTPLAPRPQAETCGNTCRLPWAQTPLNYRRGGVKRAELPIAEYLPERASPKNCGALWPA